MHILDCTIAITIVQGNLVEAFELFFLKTNAFEKFCTVLRSLLTERVQTVSFNRILVPKLLLRFDLNEKEK